jgi:ABC-type branched-subunit amino acid transport system substrate-binding protein
VTYAVRYLEYYRFAIFYPNDGYGKTLSSLFISEIYRQGGDVVTLESYANDQMDFGHEIRRMFKVQDEEAAGRTDQKHFTSIVEFDGIFIPDQANRVALIAAQLAYYDVSGVTLLGTNTWNDQSLIEKAGEFVEGALLVDEFFKESQSPVTRDFVDRFQETFNEEPTILAAQAFDAAKIIVTLLENYLILSRDSMRKELARVQNFPGVSGFNGFDPMGNAEKTPSLLTIQDKAFREVSPETIEQLYPR